MFENGKREIKEGPLSFLPGYGQAVDVKPLTYNTILPPDSLTGIFEKIEDILYAASYSHEKRYEIILQLLLCKIFDEHGHEGKPDTALDLQDYTAIGSSPKAGKEKFNRLMLRAIEYYEKHLPKKVPNKLDLPDEILMQVLQILAPIKITDTKRDVVQTFYMKFAKDLYKWDMAQYFTPTTITDFIIDIINPQFGEHICDPACGSADFIVAAFRVLREFNPGHADCVWGLDNSDNAVQVAVLNMVLNGDGKTNITKTDSLENVGKYLNRFNVITCNPPFGTKIVEKRSSVLKSFDLGYEWEIKDGVWQKTDKLLEKQEMGILFFEACVKMCKPSGRIAIILPNGYLGNTSNKYTILRNWLLQQTRIAAIVSFPRFSFKTSGADVSASVVFLEKRQKPQKYFDNEDYRFAVELIEKVGWDAGNKLAKPVYMRNADDGGIIIQDGEPVLDCDFPKALHRIINSDATATFPWLSYGRDQGYDDSSWAVPISMVIEDEVFTMDPKRLSKKYLMLCEELSRKEHEVLGALVDFYPERISVSGKKVSISASQKYGYIELADMVKGDYNVQYYQGWELPDRAKHLAEEGDIYFGSIWGSVTKWCIIPRETENVFITNGCLRCRIKEGKEKYLVDLLSYMNSEGWAIQMRAMARGSDGLAEISEQDAMKVIIPILPDAQREELRPFVERLLTGRRTLNTAINSLIENGLYNDPNKRPNHMTLV